jgi:hypothetical protein
LSTDWTRLRPREKTRHPAVLIGVILMTIRGGVNLRVPADHRHCRRHPAVHRARAQQQRRNDRRKQTSRNI